MQTIMTMNTISYHILYFRRKTTCWWMKILGMEQYLDLFWYLNHTRCDIILALKKGAYAPEVQASLGMFLI